MLLWRKLRPGELLGMWLFLLGLSSFFLGFVRGSHHPEILNGGLLPGQAVAVLLVIASGVFWWKRDTVEASA
jgi:prolipoprotein diacylglyceryltransferase